MLDLPGSPADNPPGNQQARQCNPVRAGLVRARNTCARVQSSTCMTIRWQSTLGFAVAALVWAAPVAAQKVTNLEELTLSQTLIQLVGPLGSRPVGEAIGAATALEIGTSPLPLATGNFQLKLDPATGLLVRVSPTFGPTFAERATTSGEGLITVGASFSYSAYEKLGDLDLERMQLGSVTAASPAIANTGLASLALSSKTILMSGVIGVTDNLDVAVGVPIVSITLDGITTLTNGNGVVTRRAAGGGTFTGLGDISALAKYRFMRFGDSDLNDTGGLAFLLNLRLPTGSKENLRGLGTTRTLAALVASGTMGRLRPHVNGGYEFWSEGIQIPTDFTTGATVEARHQIHYAAGVEVEASPKLTLMLTFLGRHIQGGGQVGILREIAPPNTSGITALESAVALSEGIRKMMLAPGLKLNLKGKLLLSLHALTTLNNDGLRPKITPVVALDLTM